MQYKLKEIFFLKDSGSGERNWSEKATWDRIPAL